MIGGSSTDLALDPKRIRAWTERNMVAHVPTSSGSSASAASEGLLGGNRIDILPDASLAASATAEESVDTQGAVSLLPLLRPVGGSGEEAA